MPLPKNWFAAAIILALWVGTALIVLRYAWGFLSTD
jgi:hypothetical protein